MGARRGGELAAPLARRAARAWGLALVLALALSPAAGRAQPELGEEPTELDAAKAAGQVGEQADGYLGVAPEAAGDAWALVEEINAERARRYSEIAARHGLSPTDVAALAGRKLAERTPTGQWLRDPEGVWRRK